MCGFVVCIGEKPERAQLERALAAIRHRGPDDSGIWQDEKFGVAFGHTRLSIIDLAGGTQPISNHDESLVAVVNGELYGYRHIRDDLAKDGYRFKSRSDSEIILGLYERFGVRALKFLRGEFAFVLWDKKNRLIFAARDYFGIKPLFYAQKASSIYFASEAKAFKELGIPLKFDEENFFQTMCLMPLPEESLFQGVHQVPPAHYLVKSLYASTVKTQAYWDFNYPKENMVQPVNEEEAAFKLHDVLTEAVKLRLEADVPVACYLSGGIDSCSILGLAQKLSPISVRSFTLTFDHQDYDESKQAQEMAMFAQSPFNPIPIAAHDIANAFEDAVWHAERFLINGHGVAKFLLSKAVNQAGIKVVLTGEGSDEIFGGYAHFRQDQIRYSLNLSKDEQTSWLKHLRDTNKVSSGLLLSDTKDQDAKEVIGYLGLLPGWMRSFAGARSASLAFFGQATLEKYEERNLTTHVLNYLDIAREIDGRDVLSRSLYLWAKLVLPYYLLTCLGDRMEMAHSVEGRVPFLDHKVVEYVVSLPSELKIKGLIEKYILRKAIRPYITKTVYERQKHPFLAPPAVLGPKGNAMFEFTQDTLRGQHLKTLPFVDQKRVMSYLDNIDSLDAEQKAGIDTIVLALVSACLLQKRMSA